MSNLNEIVERGTKVFSVGLKQKENPEEHKELIRILTRLHKHHMEFPAKVQYNPNGKSKTEKGRDTKERMLTEAVNICATRGLRALTHRSVAKASSSMLSTVRYHFGTINNLIADTLIYFDTECDNLPHDEFYPVKHYVQSERKFHKRLDDHLKAKVTIPTLR